MEARSYAKFEKMRAAGVGPKEASAAAVADGLDFVENLRMLRSVFKLDLVHAKKTWLQAKGIASSLDEYQERLIPAMEQALAQLDTENSESAQV